MVDPRLALGISVFATLRQALAMVRRYPGLGSFVAEIQLPQDAVIERTLRRRGHYTVWGDPDQLLRGIRRTVRA